MFTIKSCLFPCVLYLIDNDYGDTLLDSPFVVVLLENNMAPVITKQGIDELSLYSTHAILSDNEIFLNIWGNIRVRLWVVAKIGLGVKFYKKVKVSVRWRIRVRIQVRVQVRVQLQAWIKMRLGIIVKRKIGREKE